MFLFLYCLIKRNLKTKKMKKLIFLLIASTTLLACCTSADQRKKDIMSKADFPAVIDKIEMKDTTKSEPSGVYEYTVRRANGMTWTFTANIRYDVGDTISFGIDTTGMFAKLIEKVVNDSITATTTDSTRTDSIDTGSN